MERVDLNVTSAPSGNGNHIAATKRARHDAAPSAPDSARHRPGVPRVVRLLARIPLFYKILLANVVIVVTGALIAPGVTAAFVRAAPGRSTLELVGLLVLGGIIVSVVVNAVLLRLALKPLNRLEDTARRVQAGDLQARAPVSVVADPELERLIGAFNGMLDGIAGYRRRLRDVAARALNAAEDERRRIALELHDETSQILAALLLRLRVLRTVQDEHRRELLIEELRDQLAAALDGTRRFARGLRPPALDELGLAAAIESHARAVAEMNGLHVHVEAKPGPRESLPPEMELALYRIVQEALSNVARHAAAEHVVVTLEWADDSVQATIEDDGRGFDVEWVLAVEEGGLGLFGMYERADYIGGRVEIESEPDAGTRVRATIPLRFATGEARTRSEAY
ncbi:MAG: ATP-binding protein [Gemmatimonadota bacterium]|jgi:two-component system sensor histidine kinase UhpB